MQAAIVASGLTGKVIALDVHARTSQQAADALGVKVAQIAKSLVFTVNGAPIMVVAAGDNRVDEGKVARLAGGKIRRADPDQVKQATGYSIGGVPPFAHASRIPIWIDEDLGRHPVFYAAAGLPECVFPLTFDELVRASGGTIADVKQDDSRQGDPA
ncbi:MAG TPA: YbaK/EbsC family protein [Methylomirabilota bacterium]|nr:YbaK/EbsC family protein [Methylomirabilota bacterium]